MALAILEMTITIMKIKMMKMGMIIKIIESNYYYYYKNFVKDKYVLC
jgi:hypothetical protein